MKRIPQSLHIAKFLVLVAVFPLFTQLALANGVAITGNTITVTANSGTFDEDLSLATGTIENVTVPSGSLVNDLTFSFDVGAATGSAIAAGDYNFETGLFIDDAASQRRLEISVSNIELTFDASGIASGTIAAGTNAIISGRSADGSTTAQVTLTNNMLDITGSTFTITAGEQIADITNGATLFADFDNLNSTDGTYDYAVFLKQTGGVAGLTFGLEDGTAFGCAATNPMELANQNDFIGASALSGRMGYGVAASGSATAYTGTCITVPALSSGGGGGGGTTETAAETAPEVAEEELTEADEEVAGLDNNSTPEQIETAVESLTDTGDDIAALVASGEAEASLAVDFLESSSTASDTVAALGETETLAATESLVEIFETTSLVAKSLDADTLTPDELDNVNESLEDTLQSAVTLLATVASNEAGLTTTENAAATEDLLSAVEGLIEASIAVNNEVLTDNGLAGVVAALDEVSEESAAVSFPAKDDYKNLDTKNSDGASIVVTVITQGSLSIELFADGSVKLSFAGFTSQSSEISLPASLRGNSDVSALTSGSNSTVSDFANIALNSDLLANVTLVEIVGSNVQQGTFETSSGNISIVSDNIRTTVSPASINLQALLTSANSVNAEVTLLPGGGMEFSDGVVVASAGFGFEDATDFDPSTAGAATFGSPTGQDESDADYYFTVDYANGGGTQKLQPLIRDNAFFDSVAGYGYTVSTNRATGIITIDGVGDFRPSYVVSNLSFGDRVTHNLNKDSSGVSYALTDANSDGIADALVFTDSSVQLVYGMP